MKIDELKQKLDDEIEKINRIKKWLDAFANVLENPCVERISSSYGCTPIQLFIYAGETPRNLAKLFKASYEKRGSEWVGTFPDFLLTFMDAEEAENIIL